MAARDGERRYEKTAFVYFLVCKRLASHNVGVARGTIFREIRSIARFQTSDFVTEKFGGATAGERLLKDVSVFLLSS